MEKPESYYDWEMAFKKKKVKKAKEINYLS